MIQLTHTEPFAIGGRRECYVHPDDAGLCVKVHREEFLPSKLRQDAPWWRSLRKGENSFDENFADSTVLHALESENDPAIWDHVPRFHGWVETDRGRGLVIELLRDGDGLISRSLLDWIWMHGPCGELDRAIDELAEFWESRTIPSRSLGLHNIVMQERGPDDRRLVVIDGLGSTEFLPISKWSRSYALRRSRSKIARMRRDVAELLQRREKNQDPGRRGFLLKR